MMQLGAPTLWSETTGKSIFSCQERDEEGDPPDDCEFGYNWFFLDNDMQDDVEENDILYPFRERDWTYGGRHSGSESGAQTELVVLPRAGVFIAVIVNTNGIGDEACEVLAANIAKAPIPTTSSGVRGGSLAGDASSDPEFSSFGDETFYVGGN